MKNVSKLLALGLVLFLGACSVDKTPPVTTPPVTTPPVTTPPVTTPVTPPTVETKFLDKVKGKTAYNHKTSTADVNKYGTFDLDGKTFVFNNDAGEGNPVFTFVKATDENNGEYDITIDGSKTTLTITTSDGITGSAPEAGGSIKLWFK